MHEGQLTIIDEERASERDALEEVALRVRGMDAPPRVDGKVERREDDDEVQGALARLVPDGDADARDEARDADKALGNAALAVEDEAEEEEDEEDAAEELQVLLAVLVRDAHGRQVGHDRRLLLRERVGEGHEEAADDRQVAEEEGEVEDEAVTEALREDDAEQAARRVHRVPLGDDGRRAREHDLLRRGGEEGEEGGSASHSVEGASERDRGTHEDVGPQEEVRQAPGEAAVLLRVRTRRA